MANVFASSRTPALRSMHSGLTNTIHAWMLRHELLRADRAATIAPVIATFSCLCAPHQPGQHPTDPRGYQVAAMFLALFWSLDHLDVQNGTGRDTLAQLRSRLDTAQDAWRAPGRAAWLPALSELLDAMRGAERGEVQAFAAAFADHLDAVEEKAMRQTPRDAAAAAPSPTEPCKGIDEFLRLRPLLVATEPYMRAWQTVLGCWPGPSLAQTVASRAPGLQHAYPHALLDRALELARLARARTRTLDERRRSPALSEIEALTVLLTYLANDLASLDRDRRAGGPEQEPNLVLHLERYYLARAEGRARPCPWDEDVCSIPAAEHAEATTVDMYNAGAARFRALRQLVLAHERDDLARRYLDLLTGIIDGNMHGTLDHTSARAGAATASDVVPGQQQHEPRYSSVATLRRLRFIDDNS